MIFWFNINLALARSRLDTKEFLAHSHKFNAMTITYLSFYIYYSMLTYFTLKHDIKFQSNQ